MRVFGRCGVPKSDLGPAGDAGSHRVAEVVIGNLAPEFLNEDRTLRSRTHQAHLSLHHVDQLRQLVNAPFPEPAADSGDPGVLHDCPAGAILFSILAHRAELPHHVWLATQTDPHLPVEHRTVRFELDEGADESEQRRERH